MLKKAYFSVFFRQKYIITKNALKIFHRRSHDLKILNFKTKKVEKTSNLRVSSTRKRGGFGQTQKFHRCYDQAKKDFSSSKPYIR